MRCSTSTLTRSWTGLALLSLIGLCCAAPTNLSSSPLPITAVSDRFELIQFPSEVKLLEPPSWLTSWEDAEFMAEIGTFSTPLGADKADLQTRAAYWLVSMTGGYWLESNVADKSKRENEEALDSIMLSYLQSGNQTQLQSNLITADVVESPVSDQAHEKRSLSKRAWEYLRSGSRFKQSWSHVARVGALVALQHTVSGYCEWLVLGRSAVCANAGGDGTACVSWQGGWQSVLTCVANDVLNEVGGDFGFYNGFSGYCPGCLAQGWDSKKRGIEKRTEQYEQVCVSNRPDGC